MNGNRLKKSAIKFAVICGGAFVLIIALLFAVIIYVDKSAESYIINAQTAPKADAVIVLGAFVNKNGLPSPILKDRLEHGYELYVQGKAKKILVSGDHGTQNYDEVNAMKNYLLKKGVPSSDIFMDHAGFNTYDSMYRAKEIFGINKLLVSTQSFHMNRALYIARSIGVEAYGYPSEDKTVYNMDYLQMRESFAKIKAFIDTDVLKRKPKYLGDIIPISGDGTLTDG